MTLIFPNPSRNFNEARNVVCFSGYDGMFEVQFFIEAAALEKSDPAPAVAGTLEAKCLSAFDALRASIQDVARKAYAKSRRTFYTLTAADFR